MKDQNHHNQIVIYEGEGGQPHIQVRIAGETVWLTIGNGDKYSLITKRVA